MYKGKERRKKERRKAKMVRTIIIDMPLDEFVCSFLAKKRSGIGIFKAISMSKLT
jgi:hypothetical protein